MDGEPGGFVCLNSRGEVKQRGDLILLLFY